MQKEYMKILKRIINHYDVYKEIAVSLEWKTARTAFFDVSQYWREVYLRFYTVQFTKGDLQTNFADAFVQTMLTMIAYTEEWNPDDWADMPAKERADMLTTGEPFFKEYLCFERLCMQEMTADAFWNDVRSWVPWARTAEEAKKPRAFVLPDAVQNVLTQFSQAEAVWLGGLDGCAPDENWLAIQDDTFLFVAFHCSG